MSAEAMASARVDWHVYRGTGQPRALETLPHAALWRRFCGEPIIVLEVLMVNAANDLRRPLLVTGRPGAGKASLAYLIACELGLGPVLRWPVTSRTALKDALYAYDAISRVQEINALQGVEPDVGPLATALLYERLRVLLIDELDKSEADLPNDLLRVFGDGEFEIREPVRHSEVTVLTGCECSAVVRRGLGRRCAFPIVIVTSNGDPEFTAAVTAAVPKAACRAAHAAVARRDGGCALRRHRRYRRLSDGPGMPGPQRGTGGLVSDRLLNAVRVAAGQATCGAYEPVDDWQELLTGGVPLRKTSLRPYDRDAAGYEFYKGVREELSPGRSSDTVSVTRFIGAYPGLRSPIVRCFTDALSDPENMPEPVLTAETRPYPRAQEAAGRTLSVRYGPRAALLRSKLRRCNGSVPLDIPPDDTSTIAAAPESEPPIQAFARPWEERVTATEPQPLQQLLEEGQMTAPELSHSEESGRTLARQPQVWGAVPLRNPDFVGREELLEQLRIRLLEPGDRATAVLPEALHGMGGVGKSQTVVEYICRHASEYGIVWWIPSEHPTTIRSSFVDLARRLGINASSAETAVSAVLETLRSGVQNRRWILVFDNAEHPDVVRTFLPTGLGHVVVTSRNAEWAGVARTMEVDLFTRDESKELLRRRGGGNITDEDADRLAEALGDLPLAVEQAASWRVQTGMLVGEYVDPLDKDSAEPPQTGAPSAHEPPVAAAWSVRLTRLKIDKKWMLELEQLCAFFSPEPNSRSLSTSMRDASAEAVRSLSKLNQAIHDINRYGLANIYRKMSKIAGWRSAMGP